FEVAFGSATALDTGVAAYIGAVTYQSPTTVVVAPNNGNDGYNPTLPFTWGNGDAIGIHFKVPIVGWSAGTVFSTTDLSNKSTLVMATASTKSLGTSGAWITIDTFTESKDEIGEFASNAFVPRETGQYLVNY